MIRLTMVLPLAAAALAPLGAGAAGEATPAGAVSAIYRIYAGPKGDYQSGNIDDKRVAPYLTKSLRAAIKAMEARSRKRDEPILDFDPVTDSQDPMVNKLVIAPEGAAGASASFSAGDSQRVVHYRLKREDGGWKVDDIAGGSGDDKWDLRDIIRPGAK